jgi:hypothetical protein
MEPIVHTADPITDLLNRDWAAVGGWALFLGLVLFFVIGAFREWWVPGPRHRRTEQLLERALDQNGKLATQNSDLISANEITKRFFEETAPRRVTTRDNERDRGGDPS